MKSKPPAVKDVKDEGARSDETETTKIGQDFCPIVALGASAGGLESFQKFFDRMPSDTGIFFVVIQHLDPRHETLMPELLAKHTRMPVVKMEDRLEVKPNTVYVTTPNAPLSMEHC